MALGRKYSQLSQKEGVSLSINNDPTSSSNCDRLLARIVVFWVSLLVLSIGIDSPTVQGQNLTPESIESSSPTGNGNRVVSRSAPGTSVQTTIVTTSVATPTPVNPSNPASVLAPPASDATRPVSAATASDADFRQPGQTGSAGQLAALPGANQIQYPYPASYPPQYRTALLYPPVRATATCAQCTVPYQIPTLGLSNPVTVRRPNQSLFGSCCGWNRAAVPMTALQVPSIEQPLLQVQPPAQQIPSLSIVDPSQAAFPQPAVQSNFAAGGIPQIGGTSNFFNSPLVQGAGVYQPLIRLANVKPGTYLGQGIIGQPTAYVDGQPIRNLLRYISP
jgi:hypothetical protein